MDTKPHTPAKKAAIYVEIDDDLTMIIGKIRNSSADIIALVPPKRVGLLQSAVNLKLLARATKASQKRLFIVTADHALMVLAAGARIPTAETLKSEPKLAEVPHIDSKDQVIDGVDSTPKVVKNDDSDDKEISAAVRALVDDDKIKIDDASESEEKKKLKIPNFGKFQKWIIIGAAAFVALVVTVVLLIINTSATITITAKTTDEKIDQPITIAKDNGATNASEFKIKAQALDPVKKTTEIEFQATGKKVIGEKAKGAISVKKIASGTQTIPAGTTVFIGTNGYRYTTDSAITVSGSTVDALGGVVPGDAVPVNVTAQEIGSEYNLSTGDITINGASDLTASISTAIAGGAKDNITVVQQSDIDKITAKLKADTENNSMKKDLEGRFAEGVRAIPESFEIGFGTIKSSPAVDEQADKAKASIEITYSMFGLKDSDINELLMEAAAKKISSGSGEGVFDNGYKSVQVLSFQLAEKGGTARLVTTAKIGPAIDDNKLIKEATGKKSNEVKQMIEKISGVEKVEVSYFPFWVSSAPEGKITVKKNGF